MKNMIYKKKMKKIKKIMKMKKNIIILMKKIQNILKITNYQISRNQK